MKKVLGKTIKSAGKKGTKLPREFGVFSTREDTPGEAELIFSIGSSRFKSSVSTLITATKREYVADGHLPGRSLSDNE